MLLGARTAAWGGVTNLDWFGKLRKRIRELTNSDAEIVTCLISDADSCIATGVVPVGTPNIKLEYYEAAGTAVGIIFGCRIALGNKNIIFTHNGTNGQCRWDYGNAYKNYYVDITGRRIATTVGNKLYLDGSLVATTGSTPSSWSDYDIYLFAGNSSGSAYGMTAGKYAYAFEIDDSTGDRFNGVPFSDSNGGGMYDIVTDTIKRNGGSGSFSFGSVVTDWETQLSETQKALWCNV